MERVAVIMDGSNQYRLHRSTGPLEPDVSEVALKKSDWRLPNTDFRLIHCVELCLECWTEQFKKQFSRPVSTMDFSLVSGSETVQMGYQFRMRNGGCHIGMLSE